jgi:hypothetical protein
MTIHTSGQVLTITKERERRAAAAQQRLAGQQKRTGNGAGASVAAKRKPSALEQLSAEKSLETASFRVLLPTHSIVG